MVAPAGTFTLKRTADGTVTALTGETLVGRAEECNLRLDPKGEASRKHARISIVDGAAWIEDLASTNGTFVNGTKISSRTKLKSGDSVRFDQEEFQFSGGADDAREERTRARVQPPASQSPEAPPRPASQSPEAAARPASQSPEAAAKRPAGQSPEAAARRPAGQSSEAAARRPDWLDPNASGKTMQLSAADLERMRREIGSLPSAGPQDAPHLEFSTGELKGQCLLLRTVGDKVWSIGSDPDRTIRLTDEGVSGRHAKLVNEGDRWKLLDDLSQNGTYVNGKLINMSFLKSGDELLFGRAKCTFCVPALGQRQPATTVRNRLLVGATLLIVLLAVAAFVFWVLRRS
jgi:pSer/pThr/pTyr-binding forkhead associated (FHA) protein